MALFSPIWGALSDRHGRKVMVERAMFAGAIMIGLAGMAQTVQQLALIRTIQGMLTGTITAATTLVATTVPRERAGYALGLLQMAIYLGASVGPVFGGLIADSLGYRAAFWTTGVLLFVAALGVVFLVKEDFQRQTAGEDQARESRETQGIRRRLRGYLAPVFGSAALLSLLGVSLLSRLGARLLGPVMPLFIETIAPAGARVASLSGLVSGVAAGAGAIGALALGRVGDRRGYRMILVVCAVTSGLCYAPQFLVQRPALLVVLQMLTGLAMGGILSSLSASLARLAPNGQEGVVYGANATVVSIANALGPMLGSALSVWLGLRMPFLFAAGVFLLSGAAAAYLLPSPSETDG
jgi:DHA1 family multidrug resistance protein-like MFS transporter